MFANEEFDIFGTSDIPLDMFMQAAPPQPSPMEKRSATEAFSATTELEEKYSFKISIEHNYTEVKPKVSIKVLIGAQKMLEGNVEHPFVKKFCQDLLDKYEDTEGIIKVDPDVVIFGGHGDFYTRQKVPLSVYLVLRALDPVIVRGVTEEPITFTRYYAMDIFTGEPVTEVNPRKDYESLDALLAPHTQEQVAGYMYAAVGKLRLDYREQWNLVTFTSDIYDIIKGKLQVVEPLKKLNAGRGGGGGGSATF